MALSGCTSLTGTGGSNYVVGDGGVVQIAPDKRGAPLKLDGTLLDGKKLDVSSLRGKPVVINVWGSWCPTCIAETPLVNAAARQLTDAHFLGINTREASVANAEAYVRSSGMPYPSLYDPDGVALLAFSGTLSPKSTPATVILDSRGRVAAAINGPVSGRDTLPELVKQIAAGS